MRGERARVVDATTDGTSTGVDSGRGEFYPRESTRSGGLGRVAVTARGSTTRLRVRAMSRVFLLSAKSREGELAAGPSSGCAMTTRRITGSTRVV